MRFLLISILAISIIGFALIPDTFGMIHVVDIPRGSSTTNCNATYACFTPDKIEVERNDIVKWRNLDSTAHTVTSRNGEFDSGPLLTNIKQNACFPNCSPTFSYEFNEDGIYNYSCKVHSWMKGTVIVTSIGSDAEVYVSGEGGTAFVDKARYEVIPDENALVKIYGTLVNPRGGTTVFMSVTFPDGHIEELEVNKTTSGYYEAFLNINSENRGKFSVDVRFEYKNIGTITFDVIQKSADPYLGAIIETIDKAYYSSGDNVRIIITAPNSNTNSNAIEFIGNNADSRVTITTSKGTLDFYKLKEMGADFGVFEGSVSLNHVSTSGTGPWGGKIETSNQVATSCYYPDGVEIFNRGPYIDCLKIEFTDKYLGITKGPIVSIVAIERGFEEFPTKTSTVLTLNPLPSTFETIEQNASGNAAARMFVSGKLMSTDGQYVITNAEIRFVPSGFKFGESGLFTTITDYNGEFETTWTLGVGNNYGVHAVFDGTPDFHSSSSQKEHFTVTSGLTPSQPQDDGTAGVVALLVIIMVVVIAAIAIKKRKKRSAQITSQKDVEAAPKPAKVLPKLKEDKMEEGFGSPKPPKPLTLSSNTPKVEEKTSNEIFDELFEELDKVKNIDEREAIFLKEKKLELEELIPKDGMKTKKKKSHVNKSSNRFECKCGYHTCKRFYETELKRIQHRNAVTAQKTKELQASKDRLGKNEDQSQQNLLKICPKCGRQARTEKEIQVDFGYRVMKGVKHQQSWCRECRTDKPNKIIKSEKNSAIREECEKVIKYSRKIVNLPLLRECSADFLECFEITKSIRKSIQKVIEKHPYLSNSKIRRHIPTRARLPEKLQEKAFNLISDEESSIKIALYATDYYEWDGDVRDGEKVIKFAMKLAKGFEENNDLRLRLMGKKLH